MLGNLADEWSEALAAMNAANGRDAFEEERIRQHQEYNAMPELTDRERQLINPVDKRVPLSSGALQMKYSYCADVNCEGILKR